MPAARLSGDLRLIARRVFLDKLAVPGAARARHLDAKLACRRRIAVGSWQASARELEMNGDEPHASITSA